MIGCTIHVLLNSKKIGIFHPFQIQLFYVLIAIVLIKINKIYQDISITGDLYRTGTGLTSTLNNFVTISSLSSTLSSNITTTSLLFLSSPLQHPSPQWPFTLFVLKIEVYIFM